MEPVLLITLAGLLVALAVALLALRRRGAELDAAVAALEAASPAPDAVPAAGGPASAWVPDALDDLLPVGILAVGPDRRIRGANHAAQGLLEVPSGTLVGRTLMEVLLDARAEAAIREVPPGGSTSVEVRIGVGEGRRVSIRAHGRSAGDLVLVLEDLTELRRLRQIRTEFIDNLSHELRTPLTTVSLLAETAARDAAAPEVPDRLRQRIAQIEVETGHLVQMVAEILDLARVESGSQMDLVDDVDLGTLAVASAERLRLFAERQGVQLVVGVEPDLPPVRGDEARLGQVFVNLVHNAVKFSPDGGEVRIAVRRVGDMAEASVEDHGIGIPRADRARIFERFYKADRARQRGGGTGLGLAIARHVVEGHGGRIRVESEEGHGSTFIVTLPFVQPATAPVTGHAAPGPAATGA